MAGQGWEWNGAHSPDHARMAQDRKRLAHHRWNVHAGARDAAKVTSQKNSMNWEMLAAIGQLAAVFVGIPSLIYLAVQIREQTKERRSEERRVGKRRR